MGKNSVAERRNIRRCNIMGEHSTIAVNLYTLLPVTFIFNALQRRSAIQTPTIVNQIGAKFTLGAFAPFVRGKMIVEIR